MSSYTAGSLTTLFSNAKHIIFLCGVSMLTCCFVLCLAAETSVKAALDQQLELRSKQFHLLLTAVEDLEEEFAQPSETS